MHVVRGGASIVGKPHSIKSVSVAAAVFRRMDVEDTRMSSRPAASSACSTNAVRFRMVQHRLCEMRQQETWFRLRTNLGSHSA